MTDQNYDGALAEFSALRAEIDSRSKYQQQILALQLTLTSAIFGLGLSKPVPIGLLMIVPLSSYLLCGRYIGQRSAIRWASRYITEKLSPRVPGGLGWSRWVAENRRPDRLIDWYLPLMICFPGASLLALGWTIDLVFLTHGRSGWATAGLIVVWLAGLLATAACGLLVSRVFRDRGPAPLAPSP
ncbi:hypothetical protein Acy02nite_35190 [Actinoplanes cyaneus]|uniref:Uncharacterized protein n=1 Tax=Actinoplanes cyaneus TaxID=52696 RepID=A0A919ILI9_9ACTN|nr:hypothetical protein [Actinoplanes cyaneus]MCW2140320.1 hypothetical protein [Actinoplanes cyaneus]GID65638.1 hypothetical protein Acy02nite_35190 [Actinoplanes cyaneus]